eukprot:5073484-Lingulodinium_polyedra.AAC.1
MGAVLQEQRATAPYADSVFRFDRSKYLEFARGFPFRAVGFRRARSGKVLFFFAVNKSGRLRIIWGCRI